MNRVTEKLCAHRPADDYSSAPRAINGTIHSSPTTIEQIVVLVAVMLGRGPPPPSPTPFAAFPAIVSSLSFISLVAPIVARAPNKHVSLLPTRRTPATRNAPLPPRIPRLLRCIPSMMLPSIILVAILLRCAFFVTIFLLGQSGITFPGRLIM